ncbi:hypothetical protein PGN35_011465 [Nodosilinea sp. PGN35]|uniref:hypothetical protein n=1 Tax=Nodosilinea sp. PGN35 TaxID=3020489 RepID=UPI0023B31072|nr:hypothetical protein [Nodosilinea sp. TSF1-S3]MDF0366351.1 hypothetical protein [Nodosilinea sp. TSF1-S3]
MRRFNQSGKKPGCAQGEDEYDLVAAFGASLLLSLIAVVTLVVQLGLREKGGEGNGYALHRC